MRQIWMRIHRQLMALARNRGHGSSASAVTFGQPLNAGKGKSFTNETTLNRWELALGTTIMASAATFHETKEDLFRQSASCPYMVLRWASYTQRRFSLKSMG